VDAAVAAQRALELPVRMGIATGEAGLRDGDYFGTVLNRAARVMAAAARRSTSSAHSAARTGPVWNDVTVSRRAFHPTQVPPHCA
jgi:class 3 adenylate cyclase